MHDDPARRGALLAWWPGPQADRGAAEGNHRLTALTGDLLAPLLALIFLTGLFVALFAQRSRSGVLGTLHTDAAVASALLLGVHLLTYLPDALAAIGREWGPRRSRRAVVRGAAVVGALALGIILAAATYSWGVWPARHHELKAFPVALSVTYASMMAAHA